VFKDFLGYLSAINETSKALSKDNFELELPLCYDCLRGTPAHYTLKKSAGFLRFDESLHLSLPGMEKTIRLVVAIDPIAILDRSELPQQSGDLNT
jgi:hypothetical protein